MCSLIWKKLCYLDPVAQRRSLQTKPKRFTKIEQLMKNIAASLQLNCGRTFVDWLRRWSEYPNICGSPGPALGCKLHRILDVTTDTVCYTNTKHTQSQFLSSSDARVVLIVEIRLAALHLKAACR